LSLSKTIGINPEYIQVKHILYYQRLTNPTISEIQNSTGYWDITDWQHPDNTSYKEELQTYSTYQYGSDIMLNNFLDCKLLFLLSYSLDLNLIKQAFSSINNHLKWYCNDYSFLVIDYACQNISSDNAWGFFCALGYVV